MKRFSMIPLCLISILAISQNNLPELSILSVQVDEIAEQLNLSYQLNDADGDECEVWLKYSIDGGEYYETVSIDDLSGSVGNDISPAGELNLSWNYASLEGSINDVRLRVFASDSQPVDIAEMVAQVDEDQLLAFLESIEGERHHTAAPEHLQTVRELISDAFSNANLQTEAQNFSFAGSTMQNILGRQTGARDESVTFVIDGHFDGVPGSPAADDNGSAVAGMLEALRILSQYHFEHSIRYIGFDAEELGLVGSQRYVQNGIKPFEDIQGVLNFEMIGYYSDEPNSQSLPAGFEILFPDAVQDIENDQNRGNFLTVVGNIASNPLLNTYIEASQSYVPELRVISLAVPGNGSMTPDLRRSDHARFWDADIQALMLTDAADFRNENYHTPGDVISTLDFNFMKNVVKATLATAAELAIPISADFDEADLSVVLGVDEHHHHFPAELSIYPNPSNGLLTLQCTEAAHPFRARMEVYDLSGKQVHREVLNFNSGNSSYPIDLRNLAEGSYILNLNVGEASKTLSFLISE